MWSLCVTDQEQHSRAVRDREWSQAIHTQILPLLLTSRVTWAWPPCLCFLSCMTDGTKEFITLRIKLDPLFKWRSCRNHLTWTTQKFLDAQRSARVLRPRVEVGFHRFPLEQGDQVVPRWETEGPRIWSSAPWPGDQGPRIPWASLWPWWASLSQPAVDCPQHIWSQRELPVSMQCLESR